METPLDVFGFGPLAWPLAVLAAILIALLPGSRRVLGHVRVPLAGAIAAGLVCGACLAATMPVGDDWTYAVNGRDDWWAAQSSMWTSWSGRYTATALLGLWPQVLPIFGGYPVVVLLVAAIATSGCAALAWTLIPAYVDRERRIGLTAMFLLGAIAGLPSIAEGGSWLAGSITYTLPLGLSAWAWTMLLRPGPIWCRITALVLLALAAGGSELVAILNAGGLAVVLAAVWLRKGPQLRWWSLAAGIAIAGLVVSATAPGNAVRQAVVLEDRAMPGLIETLLPSLSAGWDLVSRGLGPAGLCGVAVCALIAQGPAADRRPPAWFAPLLLVTAVVIASVLVIPTLLAGTGAPPRAANVIWLAAWGCCVAAAVVAGSWCAGRWRIPASAGRLGTAVPIAAILLAFLAPGSLGRATAELVLLPDHFNAIADRASRLEQAAPGSDLDLPLLDPVRTPRTSLVYDLVPWRGDWSNQACASWYGLASVGIVVPDRFRTAPRPAHATP